MPALSRTSYHTVTFTLLRIVAPLIYFQHGAQKLFGAFGGVGPQPGGTVHLMSLMGLAGIIEFFGGLLVAFGLFTRPAAFIMSGEMAAAFFIAHFPRGWAPIQNHGELPVVLCFTFLFIAARGAGPFSLDHLLLHRSEAPVEAAETVETF
ncbi:MAG TPA: DoxX family protein [Gemmatimonadaceae bacterium]|nr:DoxX family protein [Gemmatimonadaceae bacterium]